MKKFLSVLLAVTMVVGLAATALADSGSNTFDNTTGDKENPPYTQTISVKAKIKDGSIKTRYNVKVEWADLTFTFDRTAQTWNPETHLYEGAGVWEKNSGETESGYITNAIKVTNHSNAEVSVTATAPSAKNGVTAALSITTATTLKNASVGDIYGEPTKADSVSYDVSVTGTPTTDTEFAVGDITVTISAV